MSGILICARCGKEVALRTFGLKCGCIGQIPMPIGLSGVLRIGDEQEWEKKNKGFKKVFRWMYNILKGQP